MSDIESLAAHVHNAWWEEKKEQGFHAPVKCDSSLACSDRNILSVKPKYGGIDAPFPKFHKYCDKCHPDMYPYGELPENVKDYNRMTVKTVLDAIQASGMPGGTSDGYHTFDELYEFRKLYNACLFNEWAKQGKWDVHKSARHSDGEECFGGGWFIVMAQTPSGQVSNHYEMKDWNLFKCPIRETANKWDGHTPQDVMNTLKQVALYPQGD